MRDKLLAKGQIELVALVFLGIFIVVATALTSYVVTYAHAQRIHLASTQALAIAEAGVDAAIYQLNQNAGYTGETDVAVGAGTFTVTLSSIDSTTKTLTATGYVPNRTQPVATRTVRVQISNSSSVVSFRFGVQVGEGGTILGNGATINGNLYSNGNVCDNASCVGPYSNGAAVVTGDVTVAAGTQSTPNQSWTTRNTDLNLGDIPGHASLAQSFVPSQTNPLNKVSLDLKKVGAPGDISIAIVADNAGAPGTGIMGTGSVSAANVTSSYGFVDVNLTSTPALTSGVKYWIIATAPVSATDYYQWGADTSSGGGSASHSADWTTGPWVSAGGTADFKIYLGGVVTKFHGLNANGTVWAPALENCRIGGDAFYQASYSCTLTGGGTAESVSNVAVPAAMPISIAQIRAWEAAATAVGIMVPEGGTYTIPKDTTVTLGPGTPYGEIDGDLQVNGTLLLTGPVWVKGNIVGGTGATIKVDGSIGGTGATLIADVPGSEATVGTIDISNNMTLAGNGSPGSYLMILTTNSSASAVDSGNNANSVILYVPNGTLEAKNNSSAYQITANRLVLDENVIVNYQAGLQSAHFTNGPGGSWIFLPGTYAVSP
jgi:hypothetical protein